MRTNVVLNEELVEEAMRYAAVKSKRALIDEALKTFVRVKEEERRRASYRERLRRLDARLSQVRLRESPSQVLRADRDRP